MTAEQNVNVPAFNDPYSFDDQAYREAYNPNDPGGIYGGTFKTGNTGIASWFKRLFGTDTKADQAMRTARANQAYERASIESARAWSEYMDNTQYQRRVKDLEAAGLNPWLAVQNGSMGGSSAQSVDTGGSAQANNNSEDKTSDLVKYMLAMMGAMFVSQNNSGKKLSADQERFLKNLK